MVKTELFNEKSEKLSTKIVVSEAFIDGDYQYIIQLKDLEKRVLAFVFVAFLVAVASISI